MVGLCIALRYAMNSSAIGSKKLFILSLGLALAQISAQPASAAGNCASYYSIIQIMAEKKIGQEEAGNNHGPVPMTILAEANVRDHVPWCMAFVNYIFDNAAKYSGFNKEKDLYLPHPASALGTWSDLREGMPANKVVDSDSKSAYQKLKKHLKPGWALFYSSHEGHGHAAIVISSLAKDADKKVPYGRFGITTIEGNSESPKKMRGDRRDPNDGIYLHHLKLKELSDGSLELVEKDGVNMVGKRNVVGFGNPMKSCD